MLPRESENQLSYSRRSSKFGWPVIYMLLENKIPSRIWRHITGGNLPTCPKNLLPSTIDQKILMFLSVQCRVTLDSVFPCTIPKVELESTVFFYFCFILTFLKLLTSSGCFFKREDYKFCGKLICERILKFVKTNHLIHEGLNFT